MQNKLSEQRNAASSLVLLNLHLLGHKNSLGRAVGVLVVLSDTAHREGAVIQLLPAQSLGLVLPLYPVMSDVDP